MDVRPYTETDRFAAHAFLRERLRAGPTPYTIHPGEWDWWVYHADQRYAAQWFIGPEALGVAVTDGNILSAFGLSVDEMIECGHAFFRGEPFTVDLIARSDPRSAELAAGGAKLVTSEPNFECSVADRPKPPPIPDGFMIRPLAGLDEADSRATAARRAFKSTMDPTAHTARYLRFMHSPAYRAEQDLVAVAADGRIASFAITWPDADLSLAQFEPVGTDPDFHRRGLARAVIAVALDRLAAMGIRSARVATAGNNDPAVALYQACGFDIVEYTDTWRIENY